MGTIYKKKWKNAKTGEVYESKTWWIKYYRHGKAYRESTRTDKKTLAEIKLRQREGEIAEGKAPSVRYEKILFDDLAKEFVTDYRINGKDTLQRAERSVKHLEESFKGMRATDITTDKIKSYIEKKMTAGLSNASINRELAALKRMFHLGKKAGNVGDMPYIPMLKEDNVRTGFFEYTEYVAVRDALPSYLQPFMTFAYHTAWRVDEIRNLTWDKIDMKEMIVTLNPGETKNDKGRTVVMSEELIGVMKELYSNRQLGCPYVFHREGIQVRDFRVAWKNACIEAGLFRIETDEKGKDFKVASKIFHDLRRTAVRDMVRSGVPERVVMDISGHKTRSVFDRYNIVSQKDLETAARTRQEYLERQKESLKPIDPKRGEVIPMAKNE